MEAAVEAVRGLRIHVPAGWAGARHRLPDGGAVAATAQLRGSANRIAPHVRADRVAGGVSARRDGRPRRVRGRHLRRVQRRGCDRPCRTRIMIRSPLILAPDSPRLCLDFRFVGAFFFYSYFGCE